MHYFNGLPSEGDWYVLHTRSRHEKALAQELTAQEIPHFLPLINQVRFRGRQKLAFQEPLFPGYVFLRGSLDEAYLADRTNRVAQIIKVPDQAALDWELRNLAMALACRAPLDPYPYLKTGVLVEVKCGPLRGLQGLVERRVNFDRLILQVQMLGQGVSLELHGAEVDAL